MYGPRRRRTTLNVSIRETFPFHQLCVPFVRLAYPFLSRYELEYFYEEQLQRMEQLGIETLPFDDCLCQVREAPLFPLFQEVSVFINLHAHPFLSDA